MYSFWFCAFSYDFISVSGDYAMTEYSKWILPAFNYRLVADILNDVATFLELLAPLFPTIFLYIVCVASVSKVRGWKLIEAAASSWLTWCDCRQLLAWREELRGRPWSSIRPGGTIWLMSLPKMEVKWVEPFLNYCLHWVNSLWLNVLLIFFVKLV